MAQPNQYLRFTVAQRFEHWILTLSFTLLVVTGIPQKFAGNGWAEAAIALFGGIETTRVIHHFSAMVMLLAAIYHFVVLAYKIFVLRVRWTMIPTLKDATDVLDTVRYNLGLSQKQPAYGQYNYAEKMEYLAVVWGTVIMALTGFILWNPIATTNLLPGEVIPAAKAAHGAEAILAAVAILIWHTWSVHFRTFNKAVFTGRLTEHQMAEEHGLELALIKDGKSGVRPSAAVIRQRARLFVPIAAILTIAALYGLFLLASYETTAIAATPRRTLTKIYVPLTPTPTVPLPTATATVKPQPTAAGGAPASATAATTGAKPLPASHVGRTTCQACHANGIGPANPADHAGRADSTCLACHKAGTGSTAPTAPTAPPAAATTAPTQAAATKAPTTAPSAGTAKPLPASHAGRTVCQACHANGVGPANPADHAGRAETTCTTCHKASGDASASPVPSTAAPTVAATSAPTAAATSVPTTAATATKAASTGAAKPLPASHAGRTVCQACHANGVGPANPADHAGRADTTCVACHKAP